MNYSTGAALLAIVQRACHKTGLSLAYTQPMGIYKLHGDTLKHIKVFCSRLASHCCFMGPKRLPTFFCCCCCCRCCWGSSCCQLSVILCMPLILYLLVVLIKHINIDIDIAKYRESTGSDNWVIEMKHAFPLVHNGCKRYCCTC